MKILAIANQKGGVAKTTTAVHMAHFAARFKNQRVLVVDLDPQRNTTGCFINSQHGFLTASALFFAEPASGRPTVVDEWIHVIPADSSSNDIEQMPLEVITYPREQLARLDYDLVILDTPPNLGRRLMAALVAADAVLTPFTMEKFSIDGIGDLMTTIMDVRANYNPRLKHLGVLTTKFNSRSASQRAAFEEMCAALGDAVLPHKITERVSISDAIATGLPVWAVKKVGESGRLAATEMLAACEDIYERLMK